MSDAFRFSQNVDDIDEDDEIFDNLFVNENGLSRAGTLYGMFLNSIGFNEFGLGLSPSESTDLFLKNINVKDLRNNPMEVVRLKSQKGPFNDVVDIKRIVNVDGFYKGTSYSDAQYTLSKLLDDRLWTARGKTFITDEMMNWIADKRNKIHLSPLGCNNDLMLHQTKGIMAIRIDNVKNIKIDGFINIERLHNLGEFGENVCGKYHNSDNGGHLNQVYPLQIGYTGNEVHGISFIGSEGVIMENAKIMINNLMSARSNVYGLQFYPNSNIRIRSNVDININNIHAGAYLTGKDLIQLKSQIVPNTVPRVCLVDIWSNNNENDKIQSVEFIGDNININSECVTYYSSCSFEYFKIDESYSYLDVLNEDYIKEKGINNVNCVFDVDKKSVLSTLSATSEYDMKSLDLLKQSQKQLNKQMNKEINIQNMDNMDGDKNKWIVYCIIILIVFIASMAKCMYYSSQKRNKKRDEKQRNFHSDSNEKSPLIQS